MRHNILLMLDEETYNSIMTVTTAEEFDSIGKDTKKKLINAFKFSIEVDENEMTYFCLGE